MSKRIIATIFFVLGFLTIIFFRSYSGKLIPYPFICWLIGLAFFFVWAYCIAHDAVSKRNKGSKALPRYDQ